MFFLHWGRPRHSPHYSNGAPRCLLTFIINRQSWPLRWQWVCACVSYSYNYNMWEQCRLLALQLDVLTWTLQRDYKTNVSLVPWSGWHACIHSHIHVWAHPHLDAMKCSPATTETRLRLTRPPPLMSWFGSIRCTHAIARGHTHTCTSTWCGLLIKPLNKTAFWDSSS